MLEIETDRLLLRNWKLTDNKDVYQYGKSDLVGPNAGWPPHKSEEDSKEIIKMFIKDDDVLAVVLKSKNKVIGGIGLHKKTPDEGVEGLDQREIGYVLNPSYWGNGYIPEAVNGLLEIGFQKMNLDLIWCGHFEENHKSKRVNEKCGFHYKFMKERTLTLLNDKKVVTWYYNMSKAQYLKNERNYK
jgi:RimJ/RimL family protein N-acetyltransferase